MQARSALLIGNFLSASGGVPAVGEELASELRSAGWQIHAASSRSSRWARLLDMVATVWRHRGCYQVAQVDVFSGRAFLWAWLVCWTLRRIAKPYVLMLHGGNLPAFARGRPRTVQRLLQSAAAITAPSAFMQHAMSPYARGVQVIPDGFRLQVYPFRLRRNPRPRLVWLRAFHEIYRPWQLPEVLALLANEFPDIQLNMIGPDRRDGSLARTRWAARVLNISERLHLPGPVAKSQVPAELAKADIFLNTTTLESFGVSVLEAAALGLCIVSTNVGAIPTIWQDGHDALLVPPDDPDAMAQAVRRVLTEEGLAERLSRNARRKAQQFDWSVVLPRWEGVLASAAQVRTP